MGLLLSSGSVQGGRLNGRYSEARRETGAEHRRVSSGGYCKRARCLREAQEDKDLARIRLIAVRDGAPVAGRHPNVLTPASGVGHRCTFGNSTHCLSSREFF